MIIMADSVGSFTHRYLTEKSQVFFGKKVLQCCFGSFSAVDFTFLKPCQQFFRFNIYQLNLVSIIKDIIRNSFSNNNFSYILHNIIKAFNMLDIYCRINVYSCI
ncbi:hypothetical protein SDC9_191523 [bioreactor metagenome]|uniref:Uncharacterized protein n=1 Tax=bioreactor metagenome TaxID=1076179 RepID=A0A645HZP7_9ZZZZ